MRYVPLAQLTKVQQFIAETFMSQEYARDQYAVMDWSLYDRCKVGPGQWTPQEFIFYVDLEWSPGEFKPLADTNMWKSASLPMPMAFALNKCLFFLTARDMADDDLNKLLDTYRWELRLGRKCYAEGPLARFPNRVAFDEIKPKPFTAPVDDPGLAERNRLWLAEQPPERQKGLALREVADEVLDVQIPLIIEQEIRFCVKVVGKPFLTTAKGTGVNFLCDMEGVAAMGIQ